MNIVYFVTKAFRGRRYIAYGAYIKTKDQTKYYIKRAKRGFLFNKEGEPQKPITLKKIESFFKDKEVVKAEVASKANF